MNPFQAFSESRGLVAAAAVCTMFIGACVGVPVLLGGLAALSRSRIQRHATTHGSARWATYRGSASGAGSLAHHGVVVGTMRGQTFYDDGPTHVFLCGPTRSRKGICHISRHSAPGSTVRLSSIPKMARTIQATHQARARYGPVEVFAPYWSSPVPASMWRIPFGLGRGTKSAMRRAIAHSVTAPYKLASDNSTSVHFRDLARWVITAGLLHIGYAPPRPAPASLPLLLEFLTQYHENLSGCLRVMRSTRHTPHGVHPAIAQLATMVLNIASDRELSGVWTTAIRPLEVYLDPRIAASTSTSTLSLTDLQLGPTPLSLYLLAPVAWLPGPALSRVSGHYRYRHDSAHGSTD